MKRARTASGRPAARVTWRVADFAPHAATREASRPARASERRLAHECGCLPFAEGRVEKSASRASGSATRQSSVSSVSSVPAEEEAK